MNILDNCLGVDTHFIHKILKKTTKYGTHVCRHFILSSLHLTQSYLITMNSSILTQDIQEGIGKYVSILICGIALKYLRVRLRQVEKCDTVSPNQHTGITRLG